MKPSSFTQRRGELRRVQAADAVDQVVALARPGVAHLHVADMVLHRARARREERQVGAALALDLQLRALQGIADFLVGYAQFP
jgi:hypothetical protein